MPTWDEQRGEQSEAAETGRVYFTKRPKAGTLKEKAAEKAASAFSYIFPFRASLMGLDSQGFNLNAAKTTRARSFGNLRTTRSTRTVRPALRFSLSRFANSLTVDERSEEHTSELQSQ